MMPLQFALRRRMMQKGKKKRTITLQGKFSGPGGSASSVTMPNGTVLNSAGEFECDDGDIIVLSVTIGYAQNTMYYAQITVEGVNVVRFQDMNTTKTYEYVVNSDITITGSIKGDFMPQLVLTKNT